MDRVSWRWHYFDDNGADDCGHLMNRMVRLLQYDGSSLVDLQGRKQWNVLCNACMVGDDTTTP